MRDIFDFLMQVVVPVVVIAVVLFGSLFGFVALAQHNVCERLTQLDSEHNYHYEFWTGCIIQLNNGRWVSVSNYQQIQLEEGK
jgi:hypothetical protein